MPGDCTLRECLDRMAEERGPLSASYRYDMGRVIRRMERMLGRPADIADLTPARFKQLADSMLNSGMASSSTDAQLERLTTLWRFAARQGYVAAPVRRRRKHLYARDWRRPKGRRCLPSLLQKLPEAMPRLVEKPRAARPGQPPEPEIILPTFDGATLNQAAPLPEVPAGKRRERRWRETPQKKRRWKAESAT
jgi:hypothetical protein